MSYKPTEPLLTYLLRVRRAKYEFRAYTCLADLEKDYPVGSEVYNTAQRYFKSGGHRFEVEQAIRVTDVMDAPLKVR